MTDPESESMWAEIQRGEERAELQAILDTPDYPFQPWADMYAAMFRLRLPDTSDADLATELEVEADNMANSEYPPSTSLIEAFRIKAKLLREGEQL